MFDFDGAKLLIIALVALIVIKPKDLPGVMRQVGAAVGQLRRMAGEFQSQFLEAMREAELADIKKDIEKKLDIDGLDPLGNLRNEVESTKAEIEAKLNEPASPPADTHVADAGAAHVDSVLPAEPPAHDIVAAQENAIAPAPEPEPLARVFHETSGEPARPAS